MKTAIRIDVNTRKLLELKAVKPINRIGFMKWKYV